MRELSKAYKRVKANAAARERLESVWLKECITIVNEEERGLGRKEQPTLIHNPRSKLAKNVHR